MGSARTRLVEGILLATAAALFGFAWIVPLVAGQTSKPADQIPSKQNSAAPSAGQRAIFTAPDSAFYFHYPHGFEICRQGKINSCIHAYIPVCEDDALVCVVYPADEFEGTSLRAAGFQVKEIDTSGVMMTADICATPYPQKDNGIVSDWPHFLISATHPSEMIGGVLFVHGIRAGVAAGHSDTTDLYRAFHNKRCFELAVTEAWTNPDISDPPLKKLPPAEEKKVEQAMSSMLHSFRFF
jgi:hypothetical protein